MMLKLQAVTYFSIYLLYYDGLVFSFRKIAYMFFRFPQIRQQFAGCSVFFLNVFCVLSCCRCDGRDGLQLGGDPGVSGQDEVRRDHSHLPAAGQEGLRGTSLCFWNWFCFQFATSTSSTAAESLVYSLYLFLLSVFFLFVIVR